MLRVLPIPLRCPTQGLLKRTVHGTRTVGAPWMPPSAPAWAHGRTLKDINSDTAVTADELKKFVRHHGSPAFLEEEMVKDGKRSDYMKVFTKLACTQDWKDESQERLGFFNGVLRYFGLGTHDLPCEVPDGVVGVAAKVLGYTRSGAVAVRNAKALVARCSEEADHRVWYTDFGVADTYQGWFNVMLLNTWLCTTRLRSEGIDGDLLRSEVYNEFLAAIEARMVREGVNHPSIVGKHMKQLTTQYYAMSLSLDEGVVVDDAVLASALLRHLYKDDVDQNLLFSRLAAVVQYVHFATKFLQEEVSRAEILGGLQAAPFPRIRLGGAPILHPRVVARDAVLEGA